MKTVTSSQHKISRRRCQAICCGWEEWGCCQRCVMPAKVMPGVQSSPSMSSLLWLADEWHRSINEFWDKSHKMIAGCQAQPQPNPVIFMTKCEVLMNKFQKHICTFTLTDFNPVLLNLNQNPVTALAESAPACRFLLKHHSLSELGRRRAARRYMEIWKFSTNSISGSFEPNNTSPLASILEKLVLDRQTDWHAALYI